MRRALVSARLLAHGRTLNPCTSFTSAQGESTCLEVGLRGVARGCTTGPLGGRGDVIAHLF
jgi:hypothetical protein